MLSARYRKAYPPVTFVTGILYSIPSLALFAILISIPGVAIGPAPVIIALVAYSLLILIRNTVAGLDSVPPETIDAARGMGLTNRQILFRVELPLALPVIVAGIRIATVTIIGIATIGAYIAGGGLGKMIFDGINRSFPTMIITGAVLATALAIVADLSLLALERYLRPWARRRKRRMSGILDVFKRPDFFELLRQHILLSAAALLIGIAIALPVALAIRNTSLGAALAVNIGNIGRAVPSLAILALCLPFLGFGFDTALVALTALAIPPILINASTGLREVRRDIIDAARGMGLSGSQVLTRIQLPIAAPVIFAGIRTSAVQVVASATLATFIGGGGLGELIVEGTQLNDTTILLAGSFAVAVLAIITEVGFGALEKAMTPKGLKIAQKRGR